VPLIFVATIAPSNSIISVGCGAGRHPAGSREPDSFGMLTGFGIEVVNCVPRTPIVALDVCTPYVARSAASLCTRNRALPHSISSFAVTTLSLPISYRLMAMRL